MTTFDTCGSRLVHKSRVDERAAAVGSRNVVATYSKSIGTTAGHDIIRHSHAELSGRESVA